MSTSHPQRVTLNESFWWWWGEKLCPVLSSQSIFFEYIFLWVLLVFFFKTCLCKTYLIVFLNTLCKTYLHSRRDDEELCPPLCLVLSSHNIPPKPLSLSANLDPNCIFCKFVLQIFRRNVSQNLLMSVSIFHIYFKKSKHSGGSLYVR